MRSSIQYKTVASVVVGMLAALFALAPAGQAQITGCDTIDSAGVWTIDASFTTDTGSDCIVVQADDVEVVGNDHTINGTDADPGVHGFLVDGASNVTVGNLSLTSFPADGIHVTNSDNVTVDNATTNHHGANGVTLDTVDDSLVQASEATDNTDYGVNLSGTNLDNDVRGTLIEANGQAGVYLSADTGGSVIVDNRFNNTNNTEFGASPLANGWNEPVSSDENVLGFDAYGGNYWATPAGDGFSETCDDADQNGYCDSKNTLANNNEDGTPLSPLGTLTGTVTDTAGDPVEGVTVNVFDLGTGLGKSTQTDAEGSYSFTLPESTYGLDVQPTDHGDVFAHGLHVTFEGTTTKDVQLAGTGTLDVTVEDADGNPIDSATIETFDDGKTTFQQGTTDASGSVSLDVAEGTYTLVADKSSYGQTVSPDHDVTADATTNVTLTLAAGAYINGTVEDANGNGVQGATVLADDGDRFSFANTDQNGDYSLEVGAGTYNVMVFHASGGQQSYARADGEITLASGEETSLNLTLQQPTVTNETVEILDGPGVESALGADVSIMQGLLGIRVIDQANASQGLPSDLEPVNVDASTELEINFTVEDYDPQALLWGGANVSWSTSPHPTNADATNVSIRTTPVHLAGIDPQQSAQPGPLMGQNPETVSWPTGSSDKASSQYDWNQTVFLTLFDLSTVPSDRAELLKNMTVTTNAQTFSIPQVKDDRLRVWVAGPATTSTGANHDGFYRAFIPDAQLNDWGITNPSTELSALYKGDSAAFSVNETEDGAWIEMDIDYSSGSVDIAPDVSSSSGGGGGGLVTVREGDKHTTRAGRTFSADPGAQVSLERGLPEALDRVDLTFNDECSRCKIAVEGQDARPDGAPAAAAGFVEVRFATITVYDSSADVVHEAVGHGEVAFTVDEAELDDAEPERVVLLHGGENWQPLATSLDEEAELAYTADLDGLSPFAVALDEEPPHLVDREPTPNRSHSGVRTVAASIVDNRAPAMDTVELRLDGAQTSPYVVDDRVTYVADETLAPGDHTVAVTADDASGLTSTETWSFHVPCERSPTVWDIEAGAREVTVTLQAGSCPITDAEASLAGEPIEGWFEPVETGERVTFNAPTPEGVDLDDRSRAEVTITDEAGDQVTGVDHVRSQSASDPNEGTDVEGQPSETPAAGILAAMAALAVAGRARARHR